MVESVVDCGIGAIAISDHATVSLDVDLNTETAKRGRWRFNTTLLQDRAFSETLSEDLKSFFETNMGSTEKIASVWEASKAYIRGKIIAHSAKIGKGIYRERENTGGRDSQSGERVSREILGREVPKVM